MAEEAEGLDSGAEASVAGVDPAAVALALGGASRERADAFLRDQQSLIESQKHHLHEHLKQLRLGIFDKRLSVAIELLAGMVGLAAVIGLCVAVWNASRADGLMVEAFSVPPQLAQAGTAGDVVADDLTNKLAAIRDTANGASLDTSKDVSKDRAEEVTVEIPETGVSLGQAWRYLRRWFGHERQMRGNLRSAGDGKIALSVVLEGQNAFTVSGASGDLDGLEQQAAERVFADAEPVNYVLYLQASGRSREALAAAERATQMVASPPERSDAYSLLAFETGRVTGDMALAAARLRASMAIDPKAAMSWAA